MPSGAIPVTTVTGVQITGLTPGGSYTIANTGGPWYASSGTQPHYFYGLSEDGLTWFGPIADGYNRLPPWAINSGRIDANHTIVGFLAPGTSIWIRVEDDPALYFDNTGAMGYDLEAGPVPYCAYGGEADPSKTYPYIVTDAIIDIVVTGALGLTGQLELIPYVDTALAAIEGTIPFSVNCSLLPSGGVPLDLTNPSTLAPANLLAWFREATWNWFCKCTAASGGSPDPIIPIPPNIIAPPGATVLPPKLVCDNSDICSYLNRLEQLIAQLGTQLSYLRTDVRLIERQHVPFGYVPGTLHSGLTGAGTIPVSGILGVSVQLSTIPASIGELLSSPDVFFNAGWVTTGTDDGWRVSTAVGHNPQWIDAEFDDTQIGYSFTPGVVANIQTFSHQP